MVLAFCADLTGNAKWRFARRPRRGERMKDGWVEAKHSEIALAIIGDHYRSRLSSSRARLAKLDQTAVQPVLIQAVGKTSPFAFG